MKQTCNLSIATFESQNLALYQAKIEYTLFNFYRVYVDKSSFECSSESDVASIAILGFLFLILTGLVLIALIIALLNNYLFNKRRNNLNQIVINQNNYATGFNNNDNNFINMNLNNPNAIYPGQEQKGNIYVNEPANNAILNNYIHNNNNNHNNLGELLSLNLARNSNRDVNNIEVKDPMDSENINDKDKDNGNNNVENKSSKNMELFTIELKFN